MESKVPDIKRLIDVIPHQQKTHPKEDALCDKATGEWRKYSIKNAKEAMTGSKGEAMVTSVIVLEEGHRREEIARMLSGQTITEEARAAADRLMSRSA